MAGGEDGRREDMAPTTAEAVSMATEAFKRCLERRRARLASKREDSPKARPPLRVPMAALAPASLVDILMKHRLFEGCTRDFVSTVVNEAEQRVLTEDESLGELMFNGGPLLVVEKGAVQATVGSGPAVAFGPGTVWNAPSLLGVSDEAEPFKPKGTLSGGRGLLFKGGPYEVLGAKALQDPPPLFVDRPRRSAGAAAERGTASLDDKGCLFALCPAAAQRAHPSEPQKGWLEVSLRGGLKGQVPAYGYMGGPESFHGGATLRVLPARLMETAGITGGLAGGIKAKGKPPKKKKDMFTLKVSLAIFRKNCDTMRDLWRVVMSRFAWTFAGAPPELMWKLAEGAVTSAHETGDLIVTEGSADNDSLILIDSGDVVVEKALRAGDGQEVAPIGRLGPGAIIGDLSYLGFSMARAASVRATQRTEVITLSAELLSSMLRCFPGMASGIAHRFREMGNFAHNRMPQRTDALLQTKVFSKCGYQFTSWIANNCDRTVYVAGQLVKPSVEDGAAPPGTLYVVQHGLCVAETPEDGQFAVFKAGMAFGGRTLMGVSDAEGAAVRCVSAVALILVIREKRLKEGIYRQFGEGGKDFPLNKEERITTKRTLARSFSGMLLFMSCAPEFLEALARMGRSRTYMPGQTLAVAGHRDSRLVIVTGGIATPERAPGGRESFDDEDRGISSFGELAMLGAQYKSMATVRAATFCTTLEIDTPAFKSVIASHPDEEKKFEDYAVKALTEGGGSQGEARWPFLGDRAPMQMVHMINLNAERLEYKPGDPKLREDSKDAAVLVLQGTLSYRDASGREIFELGVGQCIKEECLLAGRRHGETPAEEDDYLVPKGDCEVQLLSPALWRKIVHRYPFIQEIAGKAITKALAERAARKLGVMPSTPEVLQFSKVCCHLSDEFNSRVCRYLETHLILPGEELTSQGKFGDLLMIVLSGSAVVERGNHVEMKAGTAIGDELLLGLSGVYPMTIRVTSVMTLQVLKRRHFLDTLPKFESDLERLGPILKEAKSTGGLSLVKKLQRIPAFSKAGWPFLEMLCHGATDVYFLPETYLIEIGEECYFGKTPLYVMMAGKGAIENAAGVLQNVVGPGDLVGEGGALGLAPKRMSKVRASGKGLVHCVKITGEAFAAALNTYAEERDPIEAMMDARVKSNMAFVKRRRDWLEDSVFPKLQRCQIFAGMPQEVFEDLGATLSADGVVQAGDFLTLAGASADSMLVVVEGYVSAEDRNGNELGILEPGAAIGEVAMLGVIDARLSTLRALTEVKYIAVEHRLLEKVLSREPHGVAARPRFEEEAARRRKQAEVGLPLSAIPTVKPHLATDCLCVKAIALQSERLTIAAGAVCTPVPDTHPSGPHYWVLVSGRVDFEVLRDADGAQDASPRSSVVKVMPAFPGYLLSEGLASEYDLRIRATTACVAYRFKRIDMETALSSVTAAQKWLPIFRMVESESSAELQKRAEDALGVAQVMRRHSNDVEIHKWKDRRRQAFARAEARAARNTKPLPCPSTPPVRRRPRRRRRRDGSLSPSPPPLREPLGPVPPPRAAGAKSVSRSRSSPEIQRAAGAGLESTRAAFTSSGRSEGLGALAMAARRPESLARTAPAGGSPKARAGLASTDSFVRLPKLPRSPSTAAAG